MIQDPPSSLPLPLNTAGAPDIHRNHTDFTNSHTETVALYSRKKNVLWTVLYSHPYARPLVTVEGLFSRQGIKAISSTARVESDRSYVAPGGGSMCVLPLIASRVRTSDCLPIS